MIQRCSVNPTIWHCELYQQINIMQKSLARTYRFYFMTYLQIFQFLITKVVCNIMLNLLDFNFWNWLIFYVSSKHDHFKKLLPGYIDEVRDETVVKNMSRQEKNMSRLGKNMSRLEKNMTEYTMYKDYETLLRWFIRRKKKEYFILHLFITGITVFNSYPISLVTDKKKIFKWLNIF